MERRNGWLSLLTYLLQIPPSTAAANSKRRDDSYEVDDLVYLKLQPYQQKSLARRPFEKLAAIFYGPFHISQKIGKVDYRLELPSDVKIHPVFHISQLKRSVSTMPYSGPLPPQMIADLELRVEPEELLEVRQVKDGSATKLEVLIKWKVFPYSKQHGRILQLSTINFQHSTLRTRWFFGEGVT
ncbi:uncharacterized protein LOC141680442 [Apium graveolens]|uniref:uncharacterized protein LOC141680442 n=1 Tax=Apium graveolens TaxID=4045 RepID=UPI003D7AAFAB